jgi:hypothetical protein
MADERELRATSDLMLSMLDRLRDAEIEKRGHAPGTESFARLAYDVVELSRTVTRWSELQLRQANEALDLGATPAAPALVEVPPRRLDEVLAEWRQAEIRLSHAAPGSQEAAEAAEDAARLRDEYRQLQERKLEARGDGGRESVS